MEQISGIYMIENKINNKKYIGQSYDIYTRWIKHKGFLNNKNHHNKHLQAAWSKYGEAAFVFSIIEICEIDKLNERETFWIKKYNSNIEGYNLDLGGDGIRGYKHTEEELDRMRRIQSPLIVLQFDLNFNLINEWIGVSHAAKTLNLTGNSILCRCDHKPLKYTNISYKGYYWVYKLEYEMEDFSWDEYLQGKSHFVKPIKNTFSHKNICQYKLDGTYVKTWTSYKDLKENGFNMTSIFTICNHRKNKKTAKGFIWCYEGYDFSDGYFDKIIQKEKDKLTQKRKPNYITVPVNQYSLDGKFIKTYSSMTEASLMINGNKIAVSNINRAIKENKTCMGYKWTKAI